MDVDQGMRYELAAVVAQLGVLDPLAGLHPLLRPVPLAPGFGLIPVTDALAGAMTPAMICALPAPDIIGGPQSTGRTAATLHTGPDSGFAHLTPGLLALVEVASVRGPVAYLEADYTGRAGHQSAATWRDGALTLGPLLLGRSEPFVPGQAPISLALHAAGVRRRGRDDEFVVAGLGRHRRTEDWNADNSGTSWHWSETR